MYIIENVTVILPGLIGRSGVSWSMDSNDVCTLRAAVWCAELLTVASIHFASSRYRSFCSRNHRMRRSCSRSQMPLWTGKLVGSLLL